MKTVYPFIAGAALCAAFFTLTAFVQSEEAPSYASVNSYETGIGGSKILIIYENSTTEEIELEKATSTAKVIANTQKIHETLNLMTHKGYGLVSSVTRITGMTKFIFQRK
jgi:hypothetical protein